MSGENKNAVASTDGDSLAALDALLRIRKSGALESLIASSTTFQAQNSEASFGNRESYASSISSTSSSNLPSHLAARLSSLLPLNAASMLFSNANQHNAAMAASAAQYRLAAATNWGNSILAGNARPMSNSGSPSPAPARAGTIRRAPDPRPGSLDLDTSSDSGSGKKVESLNSSPSVRKEKVAEALRSKPQRGRKRDDLNETERLELTRTRNREHAKSTRIRKKARYQELLDREELYLQMQEEEDIQEQQKQSVLDFFSLRQSMLLDQMKRETHDQQTGEATAPQQSKTDKTMELGLSPEEAIRMKLSELVDPARSFEFDSLLPGGATADSDDAICKMFEWDEVFIDSVQYTFGSSAVDVLKSVTYEIDGGCNGIAINKGGNAFCRVELFANVPAPTESAASDDVATKRTMLLSGLCSFQFGLESNCLTSMKWTTLEDRCCVSNVRVSGKQIDIGSRGHPCLEYLGSQLIHPSVVSLDHAKQNDGDEINEPGMSI